MSLRIALGQFNAIVGGLETNINRMHSLYRQAVDAGVDVVVFPELAISGYPPEDLLLKKHFFVENYYQLEKLAGLCSGPAAVLVGYAGQHLGKNYNSMALLEGGKIRKIYRKSLLPNYGVFDEQRYFVSGCEPVVITIKDTRIALTICEDIWEIDWLARFLEPVGAVDLIVNISASPFHVGKIAVRENILARAARRLKASVAYCNLVGGQDELVFDGRSMLVDSQGRVAMQATAFEEDLFIAEVLRENESVNVFDASGNRQEGPVERLGAVEEVYKALVLGTRDYIRKNQFKRVVIGLSGGVDSALVAAIAAEALGSENVVGVTMPSRFNSSETISDAGLVAQNLGIEFHTIAIGSVLEEFDKTLTGVPGWTNQTLAYENLQARIRGTILMSLSNQFGWLVLTTGNKSETAVGYSTLYGDTAGGFAVIKDVPKTMVYKVCEHLNRLRGRDVIPQSVLTRAPSAELRPNQKDVDSLPPYEILDTILKGYVEEDKPISELVNAGLPQAVVARVVRMVDKNEYKRRQSPPGIKITPKAFGKDWRLPITNAYGQRS
jgi:NAD+ synthase (glutamine-hydrolysing)